MMLLILTEPEWNMAFMLKLFMSISTIYLFPNSIIPIKDYQRILTEMEASYWSIFISSMMENLYCSSVVGVTKPFFFVG